MQRRPLLGPWGIIFAVTIPATLLLYAALIALA